MLNKVIGNTPMVKIDYDVFRQKEFGYVKLEMFNLTEVLRIGLLII